MTPLAMTLAAGLGGVVVGVAASWIARRRWLSRQTLSQVVITADDYAELDRAAETWARQHGRPELGGLIASKLRLAHALNRRRAQRRRWRWSR